MSVLIKGMDMPNRCENCKLRYRDHIAVVVKDRCFLNKKCVDAYTFGDLDRPKWCPLVEVTTPHGRLIDADELIVIGLDDPDCNTLFEFVPKEFIDNAEVIIEAEEEE